MILDSSFYARDTVTVARELLGKVLVRVIDGEVLEGLIVETEAYTKDDPASHAYRGKTERTAVMFGPAGHAYVYFIYGNWYCLNVTARTEQQIAGGVLIRALEPVQGIAFMQKKRKVNDLQKLTNGPGKLGQALHITKQENGNDVTKKGSLYIRDADQEHLVIKHSPRIGISKAREKLWRFYIKDNPWVSR